MKGYTAIRKTGLLVKCDETPIGFVEYWVDETHEYEFIWFYSNTGYAPTTYTYKLIDE